MKPTHEAAESGRKLVNAVLQCVEFPHSIHWTLSPEGRWYATLDGTRPLVLDFSDEELQSAVKGPEARRHLVGVAETRLKVANFRHDLEQPQVNQGESSERADSHLLALLLASHDVLFELSPTLHLEFISPAWTRLTGHDVIESLDSALMDFVHPEEQRSLSQMLESLRDGALFTGELEVRLHCRDGEWRSFQLSAERRYELDGTTVASIYGTLHDITKLKDREQELLATKLSAEKASLEKSMFLASMSHEIRTPMNGLLGMINVLLDGDTTADQRQYLAVMESSCQRLLSIINDILDLSKVESGKLELEHVPFPPERVLKDTVSLLRPRAEEKGLELVLDIPRTLPTPLLGDPIRLSQALTNLVGNAIKFTKIGSVTVRCKLEETTESNVILLFSVQDTGIGIPEDRRQAIFDEYAQVDRETARKFGGTGLGLAIARRLTEIMGGQIAVESEVGKGSHFWFTAVFERVNLPSRPNTTAAHPASRTQLDLHGLRILVADDAPVNRLVASTILKKLGCEILVAENGRQALDVLEEERCDLVLMDIQMPELSGLEATWMIREKENAGSAPFRHEGRIPIIALTASVTAEERHRCLEAGMDSFLGKPLDSDLLVETIASLCPQSTP